MERGEARGEGSNGLVDVEGMQDKVGLISSLNFFNSFCTFARGSMVDGRWSMVRSMASPDPSLIRLGESDQTRLSLKKPYLNITNKIIDILLVPCYL